MATQTYDSIATTTLGGSGTNFTMSSIPQTYTDLRVVWWVIGTTNGSVDMYFNGNSGTTVNGRYIFGFGGSTSTSYQTSLYAAPSNFALQNSHPTLIILDILDYASTSIYKPFYMSVANIRPDSATSYQGLIQGTIATTSGISSITFREWTGSQLFAGTTASLYGITAGN